MMEEAVFETSLIRERYFFYTRCQDRAETFLDFLNDVCRLAKTCKFDALEGSLIRDRIIFGVHDMELRNKFLKEGGDPTLVDVIEVCRKTTEPVPGDDIEYENPVIEKLEIERDYIGVAGLRLVNEEWLDNGTPQPDQPDHLDHNSSGQLLNDGTESSDGVNDSDSESDDSDDDSESSVSTGCATNGDLSLQEGGMDDITDNESYAGDAVSLINTTSIVQVVNPNNCETDKLEESLGSLSSLNEITNCTGPFDLKALDNMINIQSISEMELNEATKHYAPSAVSVHRTMPLSNEMANGLVQVSTAIAVNKVVAELIDQISIESSDEQSIINENIESDGQSGDDEDTDADNFTDCNDKSDISAQSNKYNENIIVHSNYKLANSPLDIRNIGQQIAQDATNIIGINNNQNFDKESTNCAKNKNAMETVSNLRSILDDLAKVTSLRVELCSTDDSVEDVSVPTTGTGHLDNHISEPSFVQSLTNAPRKIPMISPCETSCESIASTEGSIVEISQPGIEMQVTDIDSMPGPHMTHQISQVGEETSFNMIQSPCLMPPAPVMQPLNYIQRAPLPNNAIHKAIPIRGIFQSNGVPRIIPNLVLLVTPIRPPPNHMINQDMNQLKAIGPNMVQQSVPITERPSNDVTHQSMLIDEAEHGISLSGSQLEPPLAHQDVSLGNIESDVIESDVIQESISIGSSQPTVIHDDISMEEVAPHDDISMHSSVAHGGITLEPNITHETISVDSTDYSVSQEEMPFEEPPHVSHTIEALSPLPHVPYRDMPNIDSPDPATIINVEPVTEGSTADLSVDATDTVIDITSGSNPIMNEEIGHLSVDATIAVIDITSESIPITNEEMTGTNEHAAMQDAVDVHGVNSSSTGEDSADAGKIITDMGDADADDVAGMTSADSAISNTAIAEMSDSDLSDAETADTDSTDGDRADAGRENANMVDGIATDVDRGDAETNISDIVSTVSTGVETVNFNSVDTVDVEMKDAGGVASDVEDQIEVPFQDVSVPDISSPILSVEPIVPDTSAPISTSNSQLTIVHEIQLEAQENTDDADENIAPANTEVTDPNGHDENIGDAVSDDASTTSDESSSDSEDSDSDVSSSSENTGPISERDVSQLETPASDVYEPVSQESVRQESIAPELIAEQHIVEELVIQEFTLEEAVIEEPVVQEISIKEPVIDDPIVQEPVTHEPVIEEHDVQQPDSQEAASIVNQEVEPVDEPDTISVNTVESNSCENATIQIIDLPNIPQIADPERPATPKPCTSKRIPGSVGRPVKKARRTRQTRSNASTIDLADFPEIKPVAVTLMKLNLSEISRDTGVSIHNPEILQRTARTTRRANNLLCDSNSAEKENHCDEMKTAFDSDAGHSAREFDEFVLKHSNNDNNLKDESGSKGSQEKDNVASGNSAVTQEFVAGGMEIASEEIVESTAANELKTICKADINSSATMKVKGDASKSIISKCNGHIAGQPFVDVENEIASNVIQTRETVMEVCEAKPAKFVAPTPRPRPRSRPQPKQQGPGTIQKILQQPLHITSMPIDLFCYICNTKFKRTNHFREHLNGHSVRENMNCTRCDINFSRFNELNSHMLNEHATIDKKCLACDITFRNPLHLQHHMKSVHSDKYRKTHKCNICLAGYTCITALEEHMVIHYRREYICCTCNIAFPTQTLVKEHLTTHSRDQLVQPQRDRTYECYLCGKQQNSLRALIKHLRLHTNKSFSCELCLRRFRKRIKLDDHLAHHAQGDSTDCNRCDDAPKYTLAAALPVDDRLTRKMRKHEDRQYSCERCKDIFETDAERRRHQLSHINEILYECDICQQTYRRKNKLHSHQQAKHGYQFESKAPEAFLPSHSVTIDND